MAVVAKWGANDFDITAYACAKIIGGGGGGSDFPGFQLGGAGGVGFPPTL